MEISPLMLILKLNGTYSLLVLSSCHWLCLTYLLQLCLTHMQELWLTLYLLISKNLTILFWNRKLCFSGEENRAHLSIYIGPNMPTAVILPSGKEKCKKWQTVSWEAQVRMLI